MQENSSPYYSLYWMICYAMSLCVMFILSQLERMVTKINDLYLESALKLDRECY